MKIKFIVVLLSLFLLVACSNQTNSDMIESGFSLGDGASESTPWISTAIRSKKKQDNISDLEIYVGHYYNFMEKWNEDIWSSNPGYGKFAIQRIILDEKREIYSEKFFDLVNFGDDSYLVTYNYDDEIPNKVNSIEFRYSFIDTINFEQITIQNGLVKYSIQLVDENYAIITDKLNFAISINSMLNFTKNGTSITFSKSNGY